MVRFRDRLKREETTIHRQSLLLIITLTLLAYANSFGNQFVFDDISHIVFNRYIHQLDKVFEQSPDNFLYSRPLTNISLAVDYQIWGANPFGYHITNFLIHLANSILLYWIVLRLWGKSNLALFAGLLFSLHPVNTETLAMIALGRGYLLATFFSLLSWFSYLKWRSDSYRWKDISVIGFISCWFLAVTANELGFILPIFILAVGLFQSDKRDFVNLLVLAAFTPLLLLLILPPIKAVLDPLLHSKEAVRLEIIPFLIARYIKLLVVPFGLSAWYEGMPIPQWLDIDIIFSVGIVGLIIGSIPILNRYDKRFVLPLDLLLYSLFIVSFRAINDPPSLMGERWVYLGSIGFCLFLALVIEKIWEAEKIKGNQALKISLIALLSGIIISYGLLVFIRNQDWKNEYTFWSATAKKAPNSGMALNNLGYAAHKKGYLDQAEEKYKRAISVAPLLEGPHINLGELYMERGKMEDAIKEFKKVIELNPKYPAAYNNLGALYSNKGMLDLAEEELKKAIAIDPQSFIAYYNLGIVYKKKGLFDDAVSELKRAIQIDPGDKEAQKVLEEIYQIIRDKRK